MGKVRAFWFAPKDGVLGYGDGRKPRLRSTHTIEGEPKLCKHGLHASTNPLDALRFAGSAELYLVELWGEVKTGEDKLCASNRKYLRRANVEGLLRRFACRQAMINIEKIRPHCSTRDFDLIILWLSTQDKNIRSAAWSAAESAARSAAESAAWSAAWVAAESAAESAAWSAAWSAARSAAWSAARSAARSAAESAAWVAAWVAAESAAESAASTMLIEMLKEELGWEI